MNTASEIIRAIYNNDLSAEDIDKILEAVQGAKNVLDLRLLSELKAQDVVKITGPIKPKYMQGHHGTFTGTRKGTKIEVDFGTPMGRFGRKIFVPVQCLTKVG